MPRLDKELDTKDPKKKKSERLKRKKKEQDATPSIIQKMEMHSNKYLKGN